MCCQTLFEEGSSFEGKVILTVIYDVGEPSKMTPASESRMFGGQEMERRKSLLIYGVNKILVPANYLKSQIYQTQ